MERVAKRFLLHNKREKEDVKESDFDELKQDIQMVRHELNNDMFSYSKNLINYVAMLHRGISVLGEHFFRYNSNSENSNKFKLFKSNNAYFEKELNSLANDSFDKKN